MCPFRLRELGVHRKIAEKWPQQLGFRVVLRLAQRGRIAFAVLFGRRDLKRAARVSVRRLDEGAHRIEPDAAPSTLLTRRYAQRARRPGRWMR